MMLGTQVWCLVQAAVVVGGSWRCDSCSLAVCSYELLKAGQAAAGLWSSSATEDRIGSNS